MKTLLRLEELAQFVVCLLALYLMDVAWWAYLLLFLGPDIGMMGYLANPYVGALTYNLLHHKAVAICIAGLGAMFQSAVLDPAAITVVNTLLLTGLVLYGHASMDRVFGYGLKFGDNFHHTHLGWIGGFKGKEQGQLAGNRGYRGGQGQ